MGIRLILNRAFVGDGFHRSGWPVAMRHLHVHHDPEGVRFDDFIEQTLLYPKPERCRAVTEPWFGIFHHPPNAPEWYDIHLQHLWDRDAFVQSLPFLRGAVVLSEYLRGYLLEKLPGVPVLTVKHPYDLHEQVPMWKPGSRRLLSLGWFLRDTRLLWRIPDSVEKIRLCPEKPHIQKWEQNVCRHLGAGEHDGVECLGYVPNKRLDQLLASSIVVSWMLDCSAANGILDCIRRNTPVFVNRHPAVVEYLGADYPLYYEEPGEILGRLQEAEQASEYMANMDKSWMDGESFARRVSEFCNSPPRE
jgi:hypothetical protein